jgi:hypothetical protein
MQRYKISSGFKHNLQAEIANNRRGREQKELLDQKIQEVHPFDEAE